MDPSWGDAGDKTKGAGGVLIMLSSTELGLDTSSISISRDGAHMRVIGIGVSMVPGYALGTHPFTVIDLTLASVIKSGGCG